MAQDFFHGLYLFLICYVSGISRVWICWGWGFLILMKVIFFFPTGTILIPVEIELVPGFSLPPSPPCIHTHAHAQEKIENKR